MALATLHESSRRRFSSDAGSTWFEVIESPQSKSPPSKRTAGDGCRAAFYTHSLPAGGLLGQRQHRTGLSLPFGLYRLFFGNRLQGKALLILCGGRRAQRLVGKKYFLLARALGFRRTKNSDRDPSH